MARQGNGFEVATAVSRPLPERRLGRPLMLLSLAALTLSAVVDRAAAQSQASDAAHQIAERFSGGAGADDKAAKAAEAAAQERAQAEKAAKEKADAARRKAEEARRNAEAKRKAAERKAAEERRLADQMRQDEADMLARARAELEALKLEERAAAEEEARAEEIKRQAEAEAARLEAEVLAAMREADQQRQQALADAAQAKAKAEQEEAARKAAETERLAQEEAARKTAVAVAEAAEKAAAAREEEGRRLEEKLARSREARLGAPTEATTESVTPAAAPAIPPADPRQPILPIAEPRAAAAAAEQPTSASAADARTVTILLSMDAGDRGIRRFNKSADPVLCIGDTCYISRGSDEPARALPRSSALGSVNTLGGRAGACNQTLTCVFRGVDLGGLSARAQPVDLRIMRHDRREERPVKADSTCRVDGGRLECREPVLADDYRMWVIAEPVAKAAGAELMRAALIEGLSDARRAELPAR